MAAPKKLISRVCPETPGDEIVISGISGRFPNSHDMEEYEYNLYNKVDMVDDEERRWRHTLTEIPKRGGKVYELEKFDPGFFNIPNDLAHVMDPQCRMLMEHSFEAILDAGIDPQTLKGTRTGVFIGCCFAEAEKSWFFEKNPPKGLSVLGCQRSFLANRLSNYFGLEGPSMLVDTACSSGLYALDVAFSAIRSGQCDSAIVGASNLNLHPYVTLQFARLGVLASDGFCRPFCNQATGYTRAETVCAMYVQKAKDTKRMYCSVLYTKTNCDGYKSEGITYPSGHMQKVLLREFYEDIGIEPKHLAYVEAHSTGTVVGDPEECMALDTVLCEGRDTPLPVGSVKSNVGHTEPAAALCSLAKIILAFHTGYMSPNINISEVRKGIPSLEENRLQVVRDVQKLEGDLIGVNGFGFGGANAHCLLKGNGKQKINFGIPEDKLPRLVLWSGRTTEAVNNIFEQIIKRPLDAEFIGLLQNTQKKSHPNNHYRGFGIFNQIGSGNAICVSKDIKNYRKLDRSVVWVFKGMGTQWIEMGTSLLNIPIFKMSIQKCQKILDKKGIDLLTIITSKDKTIFKNSLNCFLGIAAIQIGLIDILKELKMKVDYFVGHSIGELACAYADDCITAEEMILSIFFIGEASEQYNGIEGAMAEVDLGFRKIKHILPSSIDVSSYNSSDTCTISGPKNEIKLFATKLKGEGVKVKEIECFGVPYHSKNLSDFGKNLLKKLRNVILIPKKRSDKFLSSSFDKTQWKLKENQYFSAEYITKNIMKSVLFQQACGTLPTNSLTLEIGPSSMLEKILNRNMTHSINYDLVVPFKDNVENLMKRIGSIYQHNIDIEIDNLFPKINFPVSSGTPMISSHIKWLHTEDWFVTKFNTFEGGSPETKFYVSLANPEFTFMAGHTIDGRILLPATGYIYLVWEAYSIFMGPQMFSLKLEFNDVRFLRATTLSKANINSLTVSIHEGTGYFEVVEDQETVVTGYVHEFEKIQFTKLPDVETPKELILPQKDFYKELRLRGYHYNGAFKAVTEAASNGLGGKVKWESNFVSFMDCLLQIFIIGSDSRNLLLPTKIDSLKFDPELHLNLSTHLDQENPVFTVKTDKSVRLLQAGGIEIKGMTASSVGRRRPPGYPVLESYKFIPHFPAPLLSKSDGVRMIVQLALENYPALKVKAIEVLSDNSEAILETFQEALGDLPLVTSELILQTKQEIKLSDITVEDTKLTDYTAQYMIIGRNVLANKQFTEDAANSLNENGFLVSRELSDCDVTSMQTPSGYHMLAVCPTENETLVFLQKVKTKLAVTPVVMNISSSDTEYNWLEQLKTAVKTSPVILFAQNDKFSGIIGLVNCVRKEPDSEQVTCVFIDDKSAPDFDIENPYYKQYLKLGLGINVWRDGKYGSYRHLQLPKDLTETRTSKHIIGNVRNKGDLSSLNWMNGPIIDADDDVIYIKYAALNFRDCMIATGKLSADTVHTNRIQQECVLGFEFAGITKTGKRVFGMIKSGSLSTHIRTKDAALLWDCPDGWTLQESATISVVYITVYLALKVKGNVKKGQSILIHAGSGGVGLAAIRLSIACGLDIYTTVSTPAKKKYLLDTFPELKENHIGNSRSTSFEQMIKLQTKGKGVDYVLNSLAQEMLFASLRCLGHGGTFLEIGKYDLSNDTKIGMALFERRITFYAILADNFFDCSPDQRIEMVNLIQTDIHIGVIVPLKSEVFPANEIEQAFRYLASGKHMGKVLLEVREHEEDTISLPVKVHPRFFCEPQVSFIVPGGLGGFGLELVDWLVVRGAKNIVISSSRGISKAYQSYRINIWKSYGINIVINTSDISTKEGCIELIEEAAKLGPVYAIINLAVMLRDAILENQTPITYAECMAPKATATKYLDEISRNLCPQLKHFIIFSSVSCGRGNAGQSNYGMANSVMERICEQRANDGLPAKAIQWGAVGEVGLVADMQEMYKLDMEIGGTLQQRISSCLVEMDALMLCCETIVSSMVVAEKRKGSGADGDIIQTVMNIMSIRDIKSISMEASLSELGMDSLMAVEIKQTLERDFDLILMPQDLRSLTFKKLQEHADARKSGIEDSKNKSNDRESTDNLLLRNLGDEANSHLTILPMKSNIEESSCGKHALLIPGIEGLAGHAWENLASSITLPTSVLQLTKTYHLKNIPEIVSAILDETITECFKTTDYFYLIGYSYGALITLELARRLEAAGMKGHVMLIDGSPPFLQKLANINFNSAAGEEDAITVLLATGLFRLLFPEEGLEETFSKFLKVPTWEGRVNLIIEVAREQNSIYSEEFIRIQTQSFYNRIKIVLDWNLDEKNPINSPITLVRPTDIAIIDTDEDYSLHEYTTGNLNVKFLEGDHVSILENPTLSVLINEEDPSLGIN